MADCLCLETIKTSYCDTQLRQTSKNWTSRGSNAGLLACKASTLPLSYTPNEIRLIAQSSLILDVKDPVGMNKSY